MMTIIKFLKKGDKFFFGGGVCYVKQKFSDWKKDGNPYLMSTSGDVFYYEELEIEKLTD